MKIKICGITHVDDIEILNNLGITYVGLVFSKHSKRVVSIKTAEEICKAARQMSIEPVGVFLEQSYDDIKAIADNLELKTIQLHGVHSTQEIEALSQDYTVFYAMEDMRDKDIFTLNNVIPLFDNHTPGSGQPFDWMTFTPPNSPWILAGGLNANNIGHAMQLLNPSMVDVATGVEYQYSTRKDPQLINHFIRNLHRSITQ